MRLRVFLSVISTTWKTLLDSKITLSHLLDGLVDLVESDVEVELLFLEGGALLVVQLDKVLQDGVKVRCESHSVDLR